MNTTSRYLLLICCMLLASAIASRAEDVDAKKRLEAFFSAELYDVTCLDLVADERTTEITRRFQAWLAANQARFRKLVEENPGEPLPYQADMGISREDWQWYVENASSNMRFEPVGEPMQYSVQREATTVRFRLIDTDGVEARLVPQTIPAAVNLLLTSTQVNLEDTTLKVFVFDAGKAEWATGESAALGTWRGFRWTQLDERLLDLEQIPEGEFATRLNVAFYFSAKEKKVIGEYKVTLGTRDAITTNGEVRFRMAIRK